MNSRGLDLAARIESGPTLLLDGATGTELERRGVPTGLPLWSAPALIEHPGVVEAIHADYVAAGAEALTANTFRTQRRTLERGGLAERAAELTGRAVALARRAAEGARSDAHVFVLGSAPTLEDCYRPDLVPDDEALSREHAEHAAHLAAAGVDAVLIETMNTIREALAALGAARSAGVSALVSFVCWEGARLLSGEPLSEALDAVAVEDPLAVGVNCLPPSNVPACLKALTAQPRPFAVYANLGKPDDETGFTRSEDCTPAAFAERAATWVAAGARIVGGCCGTGPDHIRAMARKLRTA